jgi:hypothetical protein
MAIITAINPTQPLPLAQLAQPSVALKPAFLGRIALDLSLQDSFTLKTFKELVDEQAEAELPYYIVACRDSLDMIGFFDGNSIMQSYFGFGHTESPLTRASLKEAKVYKIESHSQYLEEFCDFFEMLSGNEHYAKFLLAANLNVASNVRGAMRYYVGGCYEYKRTEHPDRLRQAEFWYKKAAEDGYFAAYMAFGSWYEEGIYYPKSHEQALEHYRKAFSLFPKNLDSETVNTIGVKIHDLSGNLIRV